MPWACSGRSHEARSDRLFRHLARQAWVRELRNDFFACVIVFVLFHGVSPLPRLTDTPFRDVIRDT